jgi:hypothetical protein
MSTEREVTVARQLAFKLKHAGSIKVPVALAGIRLSAPAGSNRDPKAHDADRNLAKPLG